MASNIGSRKCRRCRRRTTKSSWTTKRHLPPVADMEGRRDGEGHWTADDVKGHGFAWIRSQSISHGLFHMFPCCAGRQLQVLVSLSPQSHAACFGDGVADDGGWHGKGMRMKLTKHWSCPTTISILHLHASIPVSPKPYRQRVRGIMINLDIIQLLAAVCWPAKSLQYKKHVSAPRELWTNV